MISFKFPFSALVLAAACMNGVAIAKDNNVGALPAAIATGVATEEFEFDEARLTFSINNEGQDVQDLASKLAKKGSALVDALKANGLAENDLRVAGPNISVRYAVIRNTNGAETIDRQRIDGYSGYLSVTARFKDFAKLGKSISDGVKIGATVSGPNYNLATSDEKLAKLATEATKQALSNAQAMIEATGRKAGKLLEIRTEGAMQPVFDQPMRAMTMAAPTPDIQIPINPGRTTLSRSVTVTLEILEP